MSIRALESAICAELREVAKNKKLRVKDMLEWSTGAITPKAGETLYFLPLHKVNVAIATREKK